MRSLAVSPPLPSKAPVHAIDTVQALISESYLPLRKSGYRSLATGRLVQDHQVHTSFWARIDDDLQRAHLMNDMIPGLQGGKSESEPPINIPRENFC